MAISTGNISLQGVVDYFVNNGFYTEAEMQDGLGRLTLETCFRRANSFGFDPTYGYVYNSQYINNDLFEFKGYDHTLLQTVTITYLSNTIPSLYIIDGVSSNGGSFLFTITSNGNWAPDSTVSWITFSPVGVQSRNNNVNMIVTVDPQPVNGAARSGFFRVMEENFDGSSTPLSRVRFNQVAYNTP